MGIYPDNAAVNGTVSFSIGLQRSKEADPRDDVLACATEIRQSLEKLKDPRLIKDIVADSAKIQSQAAWDKSGQSLVKEGHLITNITRRWVSDRSGVNFC